ncbi:unnamed protein product [Lota lota]
MNKTEQALGSAQHLADQLIHRVREVGGEGSPGVRLELADGVVDQDPIQEAGSLTRRELSLDEQDLAPHRTAGVKPPVVEPLSPGSEAVSVVGQDRPASAPASGLGSPAGRVR